MHANIEQLLTLRDAGQRGGAAGETAAHVTACDRCQAELARLESMRDRLRSLPPVEPPTDPWRDIASRAAQQEKRRGRRWWPAGLAAGLVAGVVAIFLGSGVMRDEAPVKLAGSGMATAASGPDRDVAALVAESRRLEQLLRSVPYAPSVVNARTAGTIAQLEDQIALVDYGLSFADARTLSPEQTSALWSQRVDLMNSLVHVRYAQAQRVDF